MISSKGLVYKDKKTMKLLDMQNEKRPVAVQIFGKEPEAMGEAAKLIEDYADIIDINMGCPAQKVARTGSRCQDIKRHKFSGRYCRAGS